METIGRDLNEMQRVPLTAAHVAAMRAEGEIAHYAAGTYLAQPGDRVDRFVYVEEGEIEIVNPFTGDRLLPSTLGPTQFMAEISFLYGGSRTLRLRAMRDSRHPRRRARTSPRRMVARRRGKRAAMRMAMRDYYQVETETGGR